MRLQRQPPRHTREASSRLTGNDMQVHPPVVQARDRNAHGTPQARQMGATLLARAPMTTWLATAPPPNASRPE